MGRVVNWIYAIVLIFLAVEALWTNFIPNEFLPLSVGLLGALILLSPIASAQQIPGLHQPLPTWTYYARKFFGAVLIVMALTTFFKWFPLLEIGTFSGSLILAGIAFVYLLASFPGTRNRNIPMPGAI